MTNKEKIVDVIGKVEDILHTVKYAAEKDPDFPIDYDLRAISRAKYHLFQLGLLLDAETQTTVKSKQHDGNAM